MKVNQFDITRFVEIAEQCDGLIVIGDITNSENVMSMEFGKRMGKEDMAKFAFHLVMDTNSKFPNIGKKITELANYHFTGDEENLKKAGKIKEFVSK